MAVERVHFRVAQGGHNVPEAVIRRRFYRGLRNFYELYQPIVTDWVYYDNSGEIPILIDEGEN